MKTGLKALLEEVDGMFPSFGDPGTTFLLYGSVNEIPNYIITRVPSGWKFSVENDWMKWEDAGLRCEFGVFDSPGTTVKAFLDYVKGNKVDVRGLCYNEAKL